jgi:hypothetical protein
LIILPIQLPIPISTPQSSLYCAVCLEDDEQSDAVQFCKECQLPLCDDHVNLHQKAKEIKDHFLVPIEQIPNEQAHEALEHKEMDKTDEEERETIHTINNDQSLSNVL